MRLSELRDKEVINIRDCKRLGHVCDLVFDEKKCHVECLIVPGPSKCFGFFGYEYEYVIPCRHICQFGDDIILVDIVIEECKVSC